MHIKNTLSEVINGNEASYRVDIIGLHGFLVHEQCWILQELLRGRKTVHEALIKAKDLIIAKNRHSESGCRGILFLLKKGLILLSEAFSQKYAGVLEVFYHFKGPRLDKVKPLTPRALLK